MSGQDQAFIYVIGPAIGAQKIGIASNPASRLPVIQTGHPSVVEIAASVAVPMDDRFRVEQCTHWLLREKHVRGEWFDVTPDEAVAAVWEACTLINQPGYMPNLVNSNALRAKIATGHAAARAAGRQIGRKETFTDQQIIDVLYLGTVKGSKALDMSKTQFIRRVERLRKKEAQNVAIDEA